MDNSDADATPSALAGELIPAQAPMPATLPPGYFDLPEQPNWVEGLSDKQRTFVTEYLSNGFSAAKAAKEVGYSEAYGATLRRDARIVAATEKAMAESGLARQSVLRELALHGFTSLVDVVDLHNGKLRDDVPDALRAITKAEFDPLTGRLVRVSVDLKGESLRTLARALRLVGPETAIGIQTDGPVKVILSKEDQLVL